MLVTRPEPGASATAQRLVAMGHQPVALPLTRTVPVDVAWPDPSDVDAVVATSASAIRHAPPASLAAFANLPFHAVGEKTAQSAAEAGFGNIATVAADVDGLAAMLPAKLEAGARVLYLAGRLRTGALAARLDHGGMRVTLLELYDTVADDGGFEAARSMLGQEPLDAALAYSAYGAAILSGLASRPELASTFDQTRCLCLSPRVAEALLPPLATRAEVAARPDEDALLALLGNAS